MRVGYGNSPNSNHFTGKKKPFKTVKKKKKSKLKREHKNKYL
jgi:hypothetical protein